MDTSKNSIRFGLGSKALLAVAAVILATTLTAGWTYHHMVSKWVLQGRIDEGNHLANALKLAASEPLGRGDRLAARQVVREFLNHESILHAAVLDAEGEPLAAESRHRWEGGGPPYTPGPVVLASTRVADDGRLLLLVRPVLAGEEGQRRVVGAVQVAVSARSALAAARRADNMVVLLACGVLLCAIPLAHWLVNRLLVAPIRSLAAATVRLAASDLPQAALGRHDELGLLARGLSAMIDRIRAQQQAMQEANEHLEAKVRERTAALDKANERLRTEMLAREDFLRAVSHDLGAAPLRNIAGMAAMALKKARGQMDEQAAGRLERIEANANVATELVQELLELSRIGLRPQPAEPVDMNRLLLDVREAFAFDLRQRNIRLEIAGDMPTLHVSRSRMLRVFLNLVDNAIKYMPDRPDGRIEITCDERDGRFSFRVADNGRGIDPAEHERIFTVFVRGSGTTDVPGKGVGLPTVRTIVTRYGGSVRVDSTAGGGAVFHISLPVELAQEPAPQAAGGNAAANSRPGEPRG